MVRLAVSPWGQVEVDGTPVGTAPPLTELTLPEGRHQIIDPQRRLPAVQRELNVTPGQPVTLKHNSDHEDSLAVSARAPSLALLAGCAARRRRSAASA